MPLCCWQSEDFRFLRVGLTLRTSCSETSRGQEQLEVIEPGSSTVFSQQVRNIVCQNLIQVSGSFLLLFLPILLPIINKLSITGCLWTLGQLLECSVSRQRQYWAIKYFNWKAH